MPPPGPSTLNIGLIEGGRAPNVIPDHASANLLIRLVGPADELRRQITAAVAGKAEANFILEIPFMELGTVPGIETMIAAFTTDIPALTNWGKPVLIGPGSIHVAHTEGEYIEKKQLLDAVDLYAQIARHLLNTRFNCFRFSQARVSHLSKRGLSGIPYLWPHRTATHHGHSKSQPAGLRNPSPLRHLRSTASSADIPCRWARRFIARELTSRFSPSTPRRAVWCWSNPEVEGGIATFPLDPHSNRTGQVWHIFVEGLDAGAHYAYRFDMQPNPDPKVYRFNPSDLLLDPYARVLSGGDRMGELQRWWSALSPRRGDGKPFRMGARSATEHSAGRQRHLRDARAQLHSPSFVGRCESRHLRRTDREDPVP